MWIDPALTSRRDFLASTGFGVGALALAHLLREEGLLADVPGKPGENLPLNTSPRAPQFAPKATAMISMFMHGGPSHVDLLDPKPELSRSHGRDYGGDVVFSFVNRASKKLFGSPWKFARHGQCGTEVSELLPETAGIVDDLCVIRSMHTGHNGHEVSIRYFHGGLPAIAGRPTMGSWLAYGLGSESRELPAYMVLSDPEGHPVDGTINWSSGFMPTLYQGTVLRAQEPRILNLDPPPQLKARPSGKTSRSSTGSTTGTSRCTLARPTWNRESAVTSWPRPCRPPPRKPSTSPANRPTSADSTASTKTRLVNTAPAA